jgi:hypothetical protein
LALSKKTATLFGEGFVFFDDDAEKSTLYKPIASKEFS